MAWSRQSFGEDVYKLEFARNMWKTRDLVIICISNKMTIHLNMFCTFMKNWILSDTDGTSIVCMKCGSGGLRKPRSQRISEQAANIARYSDSVEDRETLSYFLYF